MFPHLFLSRDTISFFLKFYLSEKGGISAESTTKPTEKIVPNDMSQNATNTQ